MRLTFLLMALMAGAGVLAYALLWIFVPQRSDVRRRGAVRPRRGPRVPAGLRHRGGRRRAADLRHRARLRRRARLGARARSGLAALGGAFIWREADDARRARWRRTAAGIVGPSRASWWRLVGGCALVIGGLSVFALGQLDFIAVRSALIAVVLTLVGVAIITIPWWLRLVRDLGDERRGRVQERERAEIAAHLHDSVLQTLALIQRQAATAARCSGSPAARSGSCAPGCTGRPGYATAGDEPVAPSSTLAASLAEAAGEIEDTYAIAVTPGDRRRRADGPAPGGAGRGRPRGDGQRGQARGGARRSASTPRWRTAPSSVFVRDRGVGFDLDEIGADRRGVAAVHPRPDGAARRHRHDPVHARRGHRGRADDAGDGADGEVDAGVPPGRRGRRPATAPATRLPTAEPQRAADVRHHRRVGRSRRDRAPDGRTPVRSGRRMPSRRGAS